MYRHPELLKLALLQAECSKALLEPGMEVYGYLILSCGTFLDYVTRLSQHFSGTCQVSRRDARSTRMSSDILAVTREGLRDV